MAVVLSAAVMAHPSRMDNALLITREQPDLAATVVTDPYPDGPPGAVRTALEAWNTVARDATHHLVLQDDIRPVHGLRGHLLPAIAAAPQAAICLFSEWASRTSQAVRLATLTGHGLVEVLDRLHTTQGVVLPAALAREFTAHVRRSGLSIVDAVADADLLFEFLRARDLTVYVTAPNLVEHIELPSLLGNDVLRGPRHSPCFAADLPPRAWTVQPAGQPAVLPHMSTDGRSYCHRRTGGGWRTEQTVDWLAGRGVALPTLIRGFHAAMAAAPDATEVRAAVNDALTFQLWITALACGLVLQDAPGTAEPFDTARALADPVADRAWSTPVPAALRKTLPPPLAARLGAVLRPVLDHALVDPRGVLPVAAPAARPAG